MKQFEIGIKAKLKNGKMLRFMEDGQMTPAQFAAYLGMSYGYVMRIMGLQVFPSFETAKIIADKIHEDVDDVFPMELLKLAEESVSKLTLTRYAQVSTKNLLPLHYAKNIAAIASDDISQGDLVAQANSLLDTLTVKERYVIERRFGLHDKGNGETFTEIGQNMNLSNERIRQIEAKAFRKLRMKVSRYAK